MLGKLTQLIKRAAISKVSQDTGQYSIAQITYNEKVGNCELLFPYGFCANPPEKSLVLVWNVHGQEENRVGMANDPINRFRELKEGEVQVGNYETESSIKFDENSDILVDSKNDYKLDSARDIICTCVQNYSLAVTGTYTVTIESTSTLTFEDDVTIDFQGDVTIDGNTITITADTIEVTGDIEVDGNISLTGTLSAGSGGQGIARIGDQVQVVVTSGSSAGTYTGTIITGSSRHTAD